MERSGLGIPRVQVRRSPVAQSMEPLRDSGFPRRHPPIPAMERIRDLDGAHIRARRLPYDIAWEYGEGFEAAGLACPPT